MAKKSSAKFNIKGLQVIQESLKKMEDGGYHIQVGIFGSKTGRRKGEVTNAEVGFVHEMGSVTRGIPRRSFLWATFADHGAELMKSIEPGTMKLFKEGKVSEYLKLAAKAAENLVQKAFDTGGFGAWAPLKYETLLGKLKGSLKKRMHQAREQEIAGTQHSQILVNTAQLRRAVASRVVGKA